MKRLLFLASVAMLLSFSAVAQAQQGYEVRMNAQREVYSRPVYQPATYYGREEAQPAIVPQDKVYIQVILPDGAAKVWFFEEKTKSVGAERLYESPRLEAGKTYSYEVTVTWGEEEEQVTETRTVQFTPGSMIVIDFTQPSN